jgi:hypothetical protein
VVLQLEVEWGGLTTPHHEEITFYELLSWTLELDGFFGKA